MGDTMQLWIGAGARRALAGSVVRGQPGGVRAAGVVRGGECCGAVPALRGQSQDGLQMVGAPSRGRGPGRPVAPAVRVPVAHAHGDGSGDPGAARRAAQLGRAQAAPAASRSWPDGGAVGFDHHRDPGASRPARSGRGSPACAADPLRARPAERLVADGFQGAFRDGGRTLPSADRARRPQPLRGLSLGLCRRDDRDGPRP
jgi:hypothetical protein